MGRRLLRCLLTPLSWPYGLAASARRRWWRDRGQRLSIPVVSVGNITCGGTGKTPTVEMVCRDLLASDWRPAILSRGYGASSDSEPNDEYLVLGENLPDVPHYQGRDRLATGKRAIAEGATVLVLDDGFQHLRLWRDLDIVLLDALRPFGYGRLLPAGLLREPLAAMESAGLVAVTRCELASTERVDAILAWLARRFPSLPRLCFETRASGWVSLEGQSADPVSLSDVPAVAFCGIGNPQAFRLQVEAQRLELREFVAFRDHHRYTASDVEALVDRARAREAAALLMTQKDAVKLRVAGLRERLAGTPAYYLRIEQSIRSGGEQYRRALKSLRASE